MSDTPRTDNAAYVLNNEETAFNNVEVVSADVSRQLELVNERIDKITPPSSAWKGAAMSDPSHIRNGRWIHVPVDDITTPKSGRICMGPRWWKVTDENCVLFFEAYTSPQCNPSKSVVESSGKGYDAPQTKPVFIEMAFIPHDCRDYV